MALESSPAVHTEGGRVCGVCIGMTHACVRGVWVRATVHLSRRVARGDEGKDWAHKGAWRTKCGSGNRSNCCRWCASALHSAFEVSILSDEVGIAY